MMKVSDPIIFGHAVRAFFPALFEEFGDVLAAADISPNDGLGTLLPASAKLPEGPAIAAAVKAGLAAGPPLAMVDSDRGITNLHVPSDVIVDASMPAMIRTSGHMWGPDGKEHDTLAVIPDSSYAGVYQAVIDDCRANGAFDPATMGSVPNVGLMAQAAEEYGSHDKTFEVTADGTVRVVDDSGKVLMEHEVSAGDIWRACQTKDIPIRDWVKLAVTRARATGAPAVFWLDEARAHDANLITKVKAYLPEHDTSGLEIRDPVPGGGHEALAGAHPPGPGHDLGDGQRAARLPHRPVPDHGAGHQRQDALGRPAAERRRPVRDRRRGIRPEARAAAGQGELPALGQPGRVPRPGLELRAVRQLDGQQAGPGAGRHPRSGHRHVPRREQVTGPPRSARSTTGAATSTSRCTGRRSWPARPTTPSWRRGSPRWPSAWRRRRRRSPASSSPCRARPRTSAATTGPTPRRPRRSCGRPRPSTRRSPRSDPGRSPASSFASSRHPECDSAGCSIIASRLHHRASIGLWLPAWAASREHA